jgi:putative resolvase
MKLSAYAHKVGVSYRTAWRWFKAGKVASYQVNTGTIIITDPTSETVSAPDHQKIVIYTRVSATENKGNLEG